MFGIGGFELFIILIFGFLIFGPDKLPEIAKTVGKGIARFREAQQEMNETLGNEKIFDPNNTEEPFKDPLEALDKIAARQDEKNRAKAAGASKGSSAKAQTSASTASKKPAADSSKPSGGPVQNEGAKAEEPTAADAPRQESFTERKARYERERAARKAAEAEAAKKAEDVPAAASGSNAGDAGSQAASATPAPESGSQPEGGVA